MKCLPSLPASPPSPRSALLSPWITLLSAVLFYLSPALIAQSVTFTGTQTTLPATGLTGPNGDAVDGAGDVFISDTGNNRVVELPRTATGYGPQATLPTSGLSGPAGMVVDGAGDVFITDSYNKRVVELPWAGTGYGPQTTLPFSGSIGPWGVALDSVGDVFITDSQNNRVLELPQTGTGYGPQTTLPFSGLAVPVGIALDSVGDVFIADAGNNRALELPQTGTGYGPQTTLPFSGLDDPYGLARDSAGDVFIADILAGSGLELPKASTGYGPQTTLPFSSLNHPIGVAVDSAGNLFLDDAHNNRVLELQTHSVNFEAVNVCPAGQTTPTPCSETLTLTYSVEAGTTIGGIKVLTQGATNLDFQPQAHDTSATLCSAKTYANATTCTVDVTFAPLAPGQRKGAVQFMDGSGNVLSNTYIYGTGVGPTIAFSPAAQTMLGSGFNVPEGVAVDASGNVFVADARNNAVKEIVAVNGVIPANPTIVTLGGGFSSPADAAEDGAGNVFVADAGNNAVKEILAVNGVIPANPTVVSLGSGFDAPTGVAVDAAGNVFVADSFNDAVKEILAVNGVIPANPTIVTLAGGFSHLARVAVDGSGNVFVAVYAQNAVEEILAVNGSIPANPTVVSLGSGFDGPTGVAVDAAGNVFVADRFNDAVKEILAVNGTIPADPTIVTLADGISFLGGGAAVDGSGNVFVTDDAGYNSVVEIRRSQPPSVVFPTPTPVGATDTADGPQTVSVWNSGNQPLLFATPSTGNNPNYAADFPENSADASLCVAGLSLAAGTSCDASMNFVPSTAGVNTGSVVLTDNALNQSGATQTISLSGIGTLPPPTINFSQGFGQAQGELQLNGSASLAGTALELTNGGLHEASSAFYPSPVNVQAFTTDFTFQLTNPAADGFTFAIQNVGPGALGTDGGSLGYAGIGQSVAIKFDLFRNHGDPSNNSTGIFVDGVLPIGPSSINLTGTGIYMHSGDKMDAHLTYDGTTLNLTLTDLVTGATWSHPFAINIPATVGGDTAYVGFTGATGGETATQQILTWSYQAGQPLYYPKGFSSGSTLSMNGSASLSGTSLQLTNGGFQETGSAFYATPVNIQSFATDFNFKLTDAAADGFTFTIQNVGLSALGSDGGSLGYAGIGNSVAVKFDLFQNTGDPSNDSTGIFVDGAGPIGPTSIDLTGTGINLHSGDKMDANLTYDGATLTLTVTDLVTQATWSHPFTINIPGTVGGNTAYVGFTGATGGLTSTQQILTWTFE